MKDTDYSNAGPNLVWNVAQTDIVMQGVKNERYYEKPEGWQCFF